jgi:hypothetical protein
MRTAISVALFFWLPPAAAQVADLHVEIRVARTGELSITERTTVVAGEGRQHRQTTSRASRRVEFHSDHDALHWTLKGAERITAEIVLPGRVPAQQIRAEARGGDAQVFVRDGRAAFRAYDGIAIVVRFPKGVVVEPSYAERVQWLLSDYIGAVLLALALILIAAALLPLRRFARKPRIKAKA